MYPGVLHFRRACSLHCGHPSAPSQKDVAIHQRHLRRTSPSQKDVAISEGHRHLRRTSPSQKDVAISEGHPRRTSQKDIPEGHLRRTSQKDISEGHPRRTSQNNIDVSVKQEVSSRQKQHWMVFTLSSGNCHCHLSAEAGILTHH